MCELWCFAAAAAFAVLAAATGATAAARLLLLVLVLPFCFAAAALLVCCCCWLLASAQITTKFSGAPGGVEWGGGPRHLKPTLKRPKSSTGPLHHPQYIIAKAKTTQVA